MGRLVRQDLLAARDAPVQEGAPDPLPAVVGMGDAPDVDPARLEALQALVDHDRSRERPVGQGQRQRVRGHRAVRVGQLVAGDLLGHHLVAGIGDPRRLLEVRRTRPRPRAARGRHVEPGRVATGRAGWAWRHCGAPAPRGLASGILRPWTRRPPPRPPRRLPISWPTRPPRSRPSPRCVAASTAPRKWGSISRRPRRSSPRSSGRSGWTPDPGARRPRSRRSSRAPVPAPRSSSAPTWTGCRWPRRRDSRSPPSAPAPCTPAATTPTWRCSWARRGCWSPAASTLPARCSSCSSRARRATTGRASCSTRACWRRRPAPR